MGVVTVSNESGQRVSASQTTSQIGTSKERANLSRVKNVMLRVPLSTSHI